MWEVKNPPGRPSTVSKQLFDEICSRLAEGESLRRICSDEHMPHRVTVFRWLEEFDDLREQYMRAREIQSHAISDLALDMTDNERPGLNQMNPQSESVRLQAIKWVAGVLNPSVYGTTHKKVEADTTVSGKKGAPPAVFVMLAPGVEPPPDGD